MGKSSDKHHFRRLVGYVLANKGLLAIVVAMGFLGFAVTFSYPKLIGKLIDEVIVPRDVNGVAASPEQRLHRLFQLTTYAILTAIGFGISAYGTGHFTTKLGNRIVVQLRRDLFDHLQRLSLHFYSKERTGGIVWRLIHEVHGVNSLLYGGVIFVILDIAKLIIATSFLVAISGRLAMAILVVLPLYVLTFKIFNPAIRKASDKVGRHIGKIAGNVHEQFTAVALVKSYSGEEREAARFLSDNIEHYGYVVHQSRVGHVVGAISEMLIHLGTTIIIGYGGYLAIHPGAGASRSRQARSPSSWAMSA